MKCKKHGEVGEPLSNGHCVKCEREMIGKEGLEILAVLLDVKDNKMNQDDAIDEVNRRLNNEKVGMEK